MELQNGRIIYNNKSISPARVFIIPVDESNRETVGKILSLLREKNVKV